MKSILDSIEHPAAKEDSGGKYCSLLRHVCIEQGTMEDYQSLARCHYRDTPRGPKAGIWIVRNRNPLHYPRNSVTAAIVYSYPAPNLAARNAATKQFFHRRGIYNLGLLNTHLRTICRVIVEPRWRGLGLGAWLVATTMPLLNVAMIESQAAMGRFHPFLCDAGMRRFDPAANPDAMKLSLALESFGMPRRRWYDTTYIQKKLDSLPAEKAETVERYVRDFLGPFGGQRKSQKGFLQTEFILERLASRPAYFAWLNPKIRVEGLELAGHES